jgi:hypothetical protein
VIVIGFAETLVFSVQFATHASRERLIEKKILGNAAMGESK